MHQQIFKRFQEVIHQASGIYLAEDKMTLLENRLRKRMKRMNISSEADYLEIIETDHSGSELVELIDAISTNHTFFFREKDHFDFLEEQLRQWRDGSEVKLWCAASSSGEEPYSLAITMMEALQEKPFRILATDICTKVLQRASQGVYESKQFQQMNPSLQKKYVISSNDSSYAIHPAVKKKILYKRLNLARFPYPLKGGLDFIFCRNVMIYFQDDLKTKIVKEFHKLLKPGGFLIVGHSESLSRVEHPFHTYRGSIYQKE